MSFLMVARFKKKMASLTYLFLRTILEHYGFSVCVKHAKEGSCDVIVRESSGYIEVLVRRVKNDLLHYLAFNASRVLSYLLEYWNSSEKNFC